MKYIRDLAPCTPMDQAASTGRMLPNQWTKITDVRGVWQGDIVILMKTMDEMAALYSKAHLHCFKSGSFLIQFNIIPHFSIAASLRACKALADDI